MANKNIIKGKCVDISSEGKGVIKTVYGVIFVDSLLLGEEAEIEVTYQRKGVAFGKIVKLLTKSEHASNILPWFKLAKDNQLKIKYIELEIK